jgi:hypothetical protein
MAIKVILHLSGESPVVGEVDQEPQTSDLFVKVSNLRKPDGKDIAYLADGVEYVIFPWHRITFLELMPSEEDRESVIDFFRA